MKTRVRLLVGIFLIPLALSGQTVSTASVEVNVVDPSGADIPHAAIKVLPLPNGNDKKVETDESGRAQLELPPPYSSYEISVSSPAFKTASQRVDVVVPGQNKEVKASVTVALQIATGSYPAVTDNLILNSGFSKKQFELRPNDFRAIPHITVKAHNEHSGKDETYLGVPLSALLAKMEAPLGKELRGKNMTLCVVATGSDGYAVALSLAEIDPDFHANQVIVADSKDGQPVEKNGPFQLIVADDRRPARWANNLASITLQQVH
jgi:hypothetical protein